MTNRNKPEQLEASTGKESATQERTQPQAAGTDHIRKEDRQQDSVLPPTAETAASTAGPVPMRANRHAGGPVKLRPRSRGGQHGSNHRGERNKSTQKGKWFTITILSTGRTLLVHKDKHYSAGGDQLTKLQPLISALQATGWRDISINPVFADVRTAGRSRQAKRVKIDEQLRQALDELISELQGYELSSATNDQDDHK